MRDFIGVFSQKPSVEGALHGLLVETLKWVQRAFQIQRASEHARNDVSEKSLDELPEDFDRLSSGNEDEDEDESSITESAELDNIYDILVAKDGPEAWAYSATKWLRICVAHVENLRKLLPSRKSSELREIMGRISLTVIGTSLDCKDNKMLPVKDFLRHHIARFNGANATTQQFQDGLHIYQQLVQGNGKKAWDISTSAGTFHCETTLLSLYLLLVCSKPNPNRYALR